MQDRGILQSKQAKLAAVLIFIIVVYMLGLSISRTGKIAVEVIVLPKDSEIFINDKKIKSGTNYISAGEYNFLAKRSGFSDDVRKVTVAEDIETIELIPEPSSDEAFRLIENNPKLQQAREELGGRKASSKGLAASEETPLIKLLPVTEVVGPFTIDYGPSESRINGSFLEISDSSPKGRVAALNWIRERGSDPTDLEILYTDYENPLNERITE